MPTYIPLTVGLTAIAFYTMGLYKIIRASKQRQLFDQSDHPNAVDSQRSAIPKSGMVYVGIGALLFFATFPLRSVDWWQYRSVGGLLSNLGTTNHYQAWEELDQRMKADRLTEDEKQDMLNRCFELSLAEPREPSSYRPQLYLMKQIREGNLSAERQKEFWETMFRGVIVSDFNLKPGDPVPYTVLLWWQRSPGSLSCYAKLTPEKFAVDDKPTDVGCDIYFPAFRAIAMRKGTLAWDGMGIHTLSLPIHIKINENTIPPEDPRGVRYDETITIKGFFRIQEPTQ
jgi:hypothetical protein